MNFFFLSALAGATPEEFAIPTIAENMVHKIVFTGYQNIDVAALRQSVTVREGALITPGLVRSSIRTLYATGYSWGVVKTLQLSSVRIFHSFSLSYLPVCHCPSHST